MSFGHDDVQPALREGSGASQPYHARTDDQCVCTVIHDFTVQLFPRQRSGRGLPRNVSLPV
jgi:hypothetical protein